MENINKLTDFDVFEQYNDVLESGQDLLASKCIYTGINSQGQPTYHCVIN